MDTNSYQQTLDTRFKNDFADSLSANTAENTAALTGLMDQVDMVQLDNQERVIIMDTINVMMRDDHISQSEFTGITETIKSFAEMQAAEPVPDDDVSAPGEIPDSVVSPGPGTPADPGTPLDPGTPVDPGMPVIDPDMPSFFTMLSEIISDAVGSTMNNTVFNDAVEVVFGSTSGGEAKDLLQSIFAGVDLSMLNADERTEIMQLLLSASRDGEITLEEADEIIEKLMPAVQTIPAGPAPGGNDDLGADPGENPGNVGAQNPGGSVPVGSDPGDFDPVANPDPVASPDPGDTVSGDIDPPEMGEPVALEGGYQDNGKLVFSNGNYEWEIDEKTATAYQRNLHDDSEVYEFTPGAVGNITMEGNVTIENPDGSMITVVPNDDNTAYIEIAIISGENGVHWENNDLDNLADGEATVGQNPEALDASIPDGYHGYSFKKSDS
ncbi:hypothetical protein [Oleiphilus messinensis]|uniref:hypothetical protein n=1 Tax=Oleiphilus messinensis TaxID=141451 RepID=UPI0018DF338C|nr:hypothetical protein [Oleiphilus messinensis]